jgi:hypothetical protein
VRALHVASHEEREQSGPDRGALGGGVEQRRGHRGSGEQTHVNCGMIPDALGRRGVAASSKPSPPWYPWPSGRGSAPSTLPVDVILEQSLRARLGGAARSLPSSEGDGIARARSPPTSSSCWPYLIVARSCRHLSEKRPIRDLTFHAAEGLNTFLKNFPGAKVGDRIVVSYKYSF